jgi:hypothetical protein
MRLNIIKLKGWVPLVLSEMTECEVVVPTCNFALANDAEAVAGTQVVLGFKPACLGLCSEQVPMKAVRMEGRVAENPNRIKFIGDEISKCNYRLPFVYYLLAY